MNKTREGAYIKPILQARRVPETMEVERLGARPLEPDCLDSVLLLPGCVTSYK